MNNGSNGQGVGFTDAGVLALLADTARAGRGNGYWGGEGGGYGGPFASPSANAVRLERNNQRLEDQARHRDSDRICDRMSEGFTTAAQFAFQGELRTNDRIRDLEREMAANAREAANCCCDIKEKVAGVESRLALQACEDKAQIIAEIKAHESRDVERALNAAQAELTALKTQVACGCNCHHHHHGGRRNP